MEERHDFSQWVKAHKKQLIVGGIAFAGLTALAIWKRDSIKDVWKRLRELKAVDSLSQNCLVPESSLTPYDNQAVLMTRADDMVQMQQAIPCKVRSHLRNLPSHCHPSPDKLATAKANGWPNIQENQTWVVNYTKGQAA